MSPSAESLWRLARPITPMNWHQQFTHLFTDNDMGREICDRRVWNRPSFSSMHSDKHRLVQIIFNSQSSSSLLFIHCLKSVYLEWLTGSRKLIVMTMQLVDPNLTGNGLQKGMLNLLLSNKIFCEDSWESTKLYQETKDCTKRKEVNLGQNLSHRAVRLLANGM